MPGVRIPQSVEAREEGIWKVSQGQWCDGDDDTTHAATCGQHLWYANNPCAPRHTTKGGRTYTYVVSSTLIGRQHWQVWPSWPNINSKSRPRSARMGQKLRVRTHTPVLHPYTTPLYKEYYTHVQRHTRPIPTHTLVPTHTPNTYTHVAGLDDGKKSKGLGTSSA